MKPLMAAVLLLGMGVPASAGATDAASNQDESRDRQLEFTAWLFRRADQFNVPDIVVTDIQTHMALSSEGKTPQRGRYWDVVLSQFIAGNDQLLYKYLSLMEENLKQYGRVSPFDRILLTWMQMSSVEKKRDRIHEFERLARQLKIETPKPSTWKAALRAASAEAASSKREGPRRRYNVESGLWEAL